MAHTSAIYFPTLDPTQYSDERLAIKLVPTKDRRNRIWKESGAWQIQSGTADQAETMAMFSGPGSVIRGIRTIYRIDSVIVEPRRYHPPYRRPSEPNRILEIHGLMGGIGEQLSLAWTAEQDLQRVEATSDRRAVEVNTMLGRAYAELCQHFVLGASQGLMNLVLRIVLLDDKAAACFFGGKSKHRREDFVPGANGRDGWVGFAPKELDTMRSAAEASQMNRLVALVSRLTAFHSSPAFDEVWDRRGMDYHRRRPQSVPHTAARAGLVQQEGPIRTIQIDEAAMELEADLEQIHLVTINALEGLYDCMADLREQIPLAIDELGIYYPWGSNGPEALDEGKMTDE